LTTYIVVWWYVELLGGWDIGSAIGVRLVCLGSWSVHHPECSTDVGSEEDHADAQLVARAEEK